MLSKFVSQNLQAKMFLQQQKCALKWLSFENLRNKKKQLEVRQY